MKKKNNLFPLSLVVIAIIIWSLNSCKKNENDINPHPHTFNLITQDTITFEGRGGVKELSLNSDTNWIAIVNTNWLKTYKTNYNFPHICFSCNRNPASTARTVKVLFKNENVLLDSLIITQKGFTETEAYTLTIDDVDFDDVHGQIRQLDRGYNKSMNIIIPSVLNGVEVKSIGDTSFINNHLTGVSIPSTVKSIGRDAFTCNFLTHVDIPYGVTTIYDAAFSNNSITELTIPNSVTSIGAKAFFQNALVCVTIPETVTSIGIAAFNRNFISSLNGLPFNGIFYAPNSNDTIIVSYGGAAYNIDFIPEDVTIIGPEAFFSDYIAKLTIPSKVNTIGESAFYNNNLVELIIPRSVKTIHVNIINANILLNKITFEDNSMIRYIGENDWNGAKYPTNVNIGFEHYKDSNGKLYSPGMTIPFETNYAADANGNPLY